MDRRDGYIMNEIMLRAENIERTYHAGSVDVPALKNCTLEFGQGEFTAIIGKSGSGKSTLLRILGSVDEPDTGSVIIAGKKITGMKDKELSEFRRRNIGYIYQDYSLFPEFTAYENVVMPILIDGKKPDENEVDDLLEELGISHCKNKFPSQMSGGEQQRVAIARALITHPVKAPRTPCVRLSERKRVPVPTRGWRPDLARFRRCSRGRKKKQDKRRGRKRPRQKHLCPQCGQLRGLLRGLEMGSKSGL